MIIIAESASNHNGEYDNLIALAKASKEASADYFTAQVISKKYFSDKTYKSSQVIEKISFTKKQWKKFFNFCLLEDIKLIPCPTDKDSLNFVIKAGFKKIKLHGSDILNIQMLKILSNNNVRVLLETQLATERDIDFAINMIGSKKILCLLHGYSNYPTENNELNLNSLDYMHQKWGLEIGFADHSIETDTIPAMAMAKGVSWIEKHITLSRNERNYDWQTSLDPIDFKIFVNQMKKYKKVLGKYKKHPSQNENLMRKDMYKKYITNKNNLKIIRSNKGMSYHEYLYNKFDRKNIITAVIGRLKSTRLKKKLLLNFIDDKMIFDLIRYVRRSKFSKNVILATSDLSSDSLLVKESEKRNIKVFCGHPDNVLDRLISLGEKEKSPAIFRVTGDMPFADPELMDRMAKLFISKKLDYVRSMNCPLGFSAELFSLNYLQKLYQSIDDPNQSEYLGWYVTTDKDARKGCVHLKYRGLDLSRYSLTVDYQEDMDTCKKLIKKINKSLDEIKLKDILSNLKYLKKVKPNKELKMPHNKKLKYFEYVKMQWEQGFDIVEDFIVK